MLYNVSTQNLANGVTTVGELVALAQEMEGMKSDELVPANQLQLLATTDDELHAAIPSGTPFGAAVSPLSTHAFYQLCGKLNMPSGYFKSVTPGLAAPHFNHWLQNGGDRHLLLRTMSELDGDGHYIRAVLSDEYAVLDNSTVLDVAQNVLNSSGLGGVSLIRPYLTRDRLSLTMTYPTGDFVQSLAAKVGVPAKESRNFAFGVRIQNSEDGTGSLVVAPLLQRHSCTNSIVFTRGGFRQGHRGKRASQAFLQAALAEHMGQAMMLGADMLSKIGGAYAAQVPSLSSVLARMGEKFGLSREVSDAIMQGSERENSLWGMINGLSYAAHAVPDLSQERREGLEALAGNALVEGWAALMTEDADDD